MRHFKMEGQERREHLKGKNFSLKTVISLLHNKSGQLCFSWSPNTELLSFSPLRLLHTALQKNDSHSSLGGLVREWESWPAGWVSQKNGTAVLKSSPIHKMPAVHNCSAREKHTIL